MINKKKNHNLSKHFWSGDSRNKSVLFEIELYQYIILFSWKHIFKPKQE